MSVIIGSGFSNIILGLVRHVLLSLALVEGCVNVLVAMATGHMTFLKWTGPWQMRNMFLPLLHSMRQVMAEPPSRRDHATEQRNISSVVS